MNRLKRWFCDVKFFFLCTLFYLNAPQVHARGIDTIPGLIRVDSAIHILVVGDWGVRGEQGQKDIAASMALAVGQLNIPLIILTGDNFYPSGVNSTTDSHWVESFQAVYDKNIFKNKWLPVLGNHDYGLNPDAQVEYSRVDSQWYMPARYYDTSIALGSDSILMVFLDTEPLERQLRGLPPPDGKYSPSYVDDQIAWLKNKLSSSTAKWKIVTGHHPLHTGGSRRHNSRVKKLRRLLQPVFHENNVTLYLAGHEHHLELLKPKGPTYYVISGGGHEARHVGMLKFHRKFAKRSKGYAILSISQQQTVLQFINDKKEVLYRYRF